MKVQNVNANNQNFTARTKKNNEYDKTNAGKFIGAGIGGGYIAGKIIHSGGFKKYAKGYTDKIVASIEAQAKHMYGDNITKLKDETELIEPILKKLPRRDIALSIFATLVGSIGIGAFIDGIVNSERRERADGRRF